MNAARRWIGIASSAEIMFWWIMFSSNSPSSASRSSSTLRGSAFDPTFFELLPIGPRSLTPALVSAIVKWFSKTEVIFVTASRITEIIREHHGLTADTALRTAECFGTDPRFWLNIQIAHGLSKAQAEGDYSEISRIA